MRLNRNKACFGKKLNTEAPFIQFSHYCINNQSSKNARNSVSIGFLWLQGIEGYLTLLDGFFLSLLFFRKERANSSTFDFLESSFMCTGIAPSQLIPQE